MKKNIKLVEENHELNLTFSLPTSALSENELDLMYGGNVEESCGCHKHAHRCECYNGNLAG